MKRKPILCLDFDGVLHSYASGWQGAACIPDPPVPGAMAFLVDALASFEVVIHSSRSGQEGGTLAMCDWLRKHLTGHLHNSLHARDVVRCIGFPSQKPPAFVTLDDRAITFDGRFPSVSSLLAFKPWNEPGTVQWPSSRPLPGIWECRDDGQGGWGWNWLGDDLDDAAWRAAAPKPEQLF